MSTLVSCVLLAAAAVTNAGAATFEPTRLDDPPRGKCKPRDCSLREAIEAANDRVGRDRILLDKGTYRMEQVPVPGTASNKDGQFYPSDGVTIRGLGPRKTKIDANHLDRAFSVATLAPKTVIEGVTIREGDASADPEHPNAGGGLFITGEDVVLRDVVVKDNQAQFGGGIKAAGDQLTIVNSTIIVNQGQEGGGIDLRANFVQPDVQIRSSTISGNTAQNGGGVMVDGTAAGGQVAPILFVENSTIALNFAFTSAGGVAGGQNAIVVLDNTTVASNGADADGVGGGLAGGIFQGNNASFQLTDSVLALNTVGDSGSGPACHGEFEGAGSLVDASGSNPNCNFVGLFQPDTTTTPMIGSLEDNGGPTKTIKLLSGSPAIGIALGCPNKDQRGKPRPDTGCDAGAFERKGP